MGFETMAYDMANALYLARGVSSCSTILYAIDRLPNSLVVIHSEHSD